MFYDDSCQRREPALEFLGSGCFPSLCMWPRVDLEAVTPSRCGGGVMHQGDDRFFDPFFGESFLNPRQKYLRRLRSRKKGMESLDSNLPFPSRSTTT